MNDFFNQLNKVFDSRVRLGIMSLLMVNEWVSYKEMKQALSGKDKKDPITDGNLASHLKRLRAEEYIEDRKRFVGRKPQTDYRATKAGRKAFKDHLDGLAKLLDSV
ncbi:MAG: winged helix-turn-helix domain-containing protein [Bacteroidia bacterium]